MHGRPRYPRPNPTDPQKAQAAEQRVNNGLYSLGSQVSDEVSSQASCLLQVLLYSRLTSTVLKRLQAGQYDKETLDLAARLLEQNPEVYTLWNHRKRALLTTLSNGGDPAAEAIRTELALTQKALQKHPKSYATWHHRRWLVSQHVTSLEQEVELVNRCVNFCPALCILVHCSNCMSLARSCCHALCKIHAGHCFMHVTIYNP